MREHSSSDFASGGEDPLSEENVRFRNIVDTIPAALVGVDAAGRIQIANPRVSEMFGFAPGELIGQPVEVLLPESFRAGHQLYRGDYFTDPQPRPMGVGRDLAGRRKDGSEFPVEIGLSFTHTAEGPLALAFITDITERKKAEQRLLESEERFHTIVDTIPAAVLAIGKGGQILVVNPRVQELFGYRADELLNQPVEMLLPERYRGGHGAFRSDYFRDPVSRSMGMGRDLAGRRKDGSEFPVEIGLSFTHTAEGPLALAFITDITTRKQAENALERSQEQLRILIESAPAAIAMFDRQMCYLAASRAWLRDYGLGDQSVLGRSHYEFFPEIGEEWKKVHRLGMAGETIRAEEDRFERLDGSVQWLRWVVAPWRGTDGAVGGITILAEDITARVEAERSLDEQRRKFERLFEVLPVGVSVLGPDRKVLMHNPALERILSMTSEGLAQGTYRQWRFLRSDGAPMPPEEMPSSRVLAGEAAVEKVEVGVVPEDGETIWTEISAVATPIADWSQVIVTVDITQRKHIEERIRQAEAQLRQAVRAANIGLWRWDLDGNRVVYSAEWKHQLGYDEHEIVDDFSEWESRVHPDDREAAKERVQAFLANPSPGYSNEFRMRHKDGSYRWIMAQAALIHNEQGQPILMIGSHIDITGLKATEERIRQSEQRYRDILDSMVEGFQLIGRDWRYLVLNDAAAQHGRKAREELLGRTMMEVYPGIEQSPLFAVMKRCMDQREAAYLENRFEYEDGSSRWFDLRLRPVDEGIFILSYDITDRKQAAQEILSLNADLERRVEERTAQLEAANRELDAFAYSVSHDLRAPLRAIHGFSQILVEDYHHLLGEEGQEYLDLVMRSSQQMGILIDDLLAFSRLGRQSITRITVNPESLVREIITILSGSLQGRSIHFDVQSMPACLADHGLLRQVYSNLLENAIKFTRQQAQARIEVGAEQQGDETVYFVRDNGVGFDMKYADKIFGVFQRLHLVEEYEGTGVGLATVERIVRRHGGRIWAQAQPAAGATFYFTLPESESSHG